MQDKWHLEFWKPDGSKAGIDLYGYCSNDIIQSAKELFGKNYYETASFPERVENANTESN